MDRLYKMDAGGQLDGCLSTIHNSSYPFISMSIHSFIQVSYSFTHPSIQRTDRCFDSYTNRQKVIKVLKVYGVFPSWLCMGRVSAAPAEQSRVPVRRAQLQAANKSFSLNKRCVEVSRVLSCLSGHIKGCVYVVVCVARAAEKEEGRSVRDGGRVPDCIRAAAEEKEREGAAAGRKRHTHTRERCSN